MTPRAKARRATTKRAAARRLVTKRAATKRAAPKRADTRRPTTKRAATKRAATKRAGTKRPSSRRVATKRAATTARAKRTTRGASAGRRTGPRTMSRTRRAPRRTRAPLALVPKPVPPAFPQTLDGSVKQRLLFELLRARTAVMAAIHGLSGGSSEQPIAAGKWTVREIVLHLVVRDRARLRDMEAAWLGRRPSWFDEDKVAVVRTNEADLAPLRQHGWDEAVRLLQSTRQQLMDAIEAVPDEPAERWTETHPFGALLTRLPTHDRHHAEAIKHWRSTRGA